MNWISVNEKLPSKGEEVIVHDLLYGIRVCVYTYDNQWERIDTESLLFKVTHWMSLPSKPNKL